MGVIFIRHAQSETNIGGISKPNAQIRLSPLGEIQAQELTDHIQTKPSHIFVSEYIRTHQTAAPLLKKFDLQATVLPCLNEFNAYGYEEVKGLTGAQRLPLTRRYWRECDPDSTHGEGSQSFNEFCQQVMHFIALLEEGSIPDGSIVFGHGMWFSVFSWLQKNAIKSLVNQEQMADFFKYLKRNHPKNAEILPMK